MTASTSATLFVCESRKCSSKNKMTNKISVSSSSRCCSSVNVWR